MSFQNHIKQVAPRLSQIKSRQPAMLLGNKIIVAGIGGNFIPGAQSSSDSTSTAIADISAGYITVSDSVVTLHDLTKGTTSIADKIYIPDTGVQEPDYAAGGTPQPAPASMDFYKCAAVYSDSTWSGYKAVLRDNKYNFQSQSTSNLSYSYDLIPTVGHIYTQNTTLQIINPYTAVPRDYIFYSSFSRQASKTQTGQTIDASATFTYQMKNNVPCIKVDDIAQYIQMDGVNLTQATNVFSVSFYLYMPSTEVETAKAFPRLMSIGPTSGLGDYTNNYITCTYIASSGGILIQTPDNNKWTHSVVPASYSYRDKWSHILIVFNQTFSSVYIDGIKISDSPTFEAAFSLPAKPTITINKSWQGDWQGIKGYYIAAIRMYNRLLSSPEIFALTSQFTPTSN